jgi:hypothetical protein
MEIVVRLTAVVAESGGVYAMMESGQAGSGTTLETCSNQFPVMVTGSGGEPWGNVTGVGFVLATMISAGFTSNWADWLADEVVRVRE